MSKISDRATLKAKRCYLREQNALFGSRMELLSEGDAERAAHSLGHAPLKAWRSRRFLAVLWDTPKEARQRLSVCRTELGDDGRFSDGITWDELQRVKSQCGFGEIEALEVFPRDVDVVNVANQRHLWLIPEGTGLAWKAGRSSGGGRMIWLALALMALAFVLATSLVRAGSQADAAMRSAWERQTRRTR